MSDTKGSSFMELRRGPWTLEEDSLLIHYIALHGEGRWNLLARCSGLKRTGKSCRLRWLNYLKPDVKRGNLSAEEQFMILELHSRWGNRWSRIAQHLPGRTDNEIKNYWRTRVQKQARQMKIDSNSSLFADAVRCFWMPRLLEKMAASSSSSSSLINQTSLPSSCSTAVTHDHHHQYQADETVNYQYSEGGFDDPAGSQLLFKSSSNSEMMNEIPNSASTCSFMDDDDELGTLLENSSFMDDDSSWLVDELWHVRKVHEWGGGTGI
ncbi:hypothetical protein J5N97_027835 [Dioscorea zingiberensis]|uniref:Uncharacterized protein n=1 Tax=Dioscorea zingiberensis TaxID=325984 RepID=A0A9D5BXX3_9LILI|nr:hypothetical protein J5N97_027835 [Dioscorea zingiberensis]